MTALRGFRWKTFTLCQTVKLKGDEENKSAMTSSHQCFVGPFYRSGWKSRSGPALWHAGRDSTLMRHRRGDRWRDAVCGIASHPSVPVGEKANRVFPYSSATKKQIEVADISRALLLRPLAAHVREEFPDGLDEAHSACLWCRAPALC